MQSNHVRFGRFFSVEFIRICIVSLCLLMVCTITAAHQTGNSYLTIRQVDDHLSLELDFYVRDIGNLLQTPGKPTDPSPSADKLRLLQLPITEAIQHSLKIEVDDQTLPLSFTGQSVILHNDGLYVRQQFVAPVVAKTSRFIVIRYEFFTQNDQLGRAFFKMELYGEEVSSVFDQQNAIQRFALGQTKRLATIFLFTKEGAKHIWSGADHLLFLLTLLLPGITLWRKQSNGPAASDLLPVRTNRQAEMFALKVVTAFTLAHSITLAMATFGLVTLPEKLIESLIAFSIMATAVMNLQTRYRFNHWQVAFAFGLIHGLGFANGLKELGLSSLYFLETLLAFNAGVELGQLSTVVVVSTPILLAVRTDEGKARILKWGSIAVLAIATVWFIERLLA